MASSLNYLNYLNIVGYIINTFVVFGAQPLFGLANVGSLSEEYQTIVTPAGFAFAIWGFIFIFQAIFTIHQALPQFRSIDLVQKGVKYWYFVACLAQSAWVFAFGYIQILLSVICMTLILIALLHIVILQSKLPWEEGGSPIRDFWLFEFPFYIHCGWIFAAFALNINLAIVYSDSEASIQLGWAILTLIYILVISGGALFVLKRVNYTIPSILAWATLGIAVELRNPKLLILQTFSEQTIYNVMVITACICALISTTTLAYGLYNIITAKQNEVEDGVTNEGSALVSSEAVTYA